MSDYSNDKQMAYYPIRIVSAETGVNAITLRAWERRYGLISPMRTAKGHRLYTEQDIQLIRKVVALLNRGIPVSQAQAMLNDGETDDDLPAAAPPSRPSQWQHYREQLNQAVQAFDEAAVAALFSEIGQFFPVDVALRFLFLPLYRHLQENATQYQGMPRLRFYAAFLQGRLASRLTDEINAEGASVILANCSQDDDINLLLLAILLRQHGLRPVWFNGQLTPLQLKELLQMPRWQALVIQTGTSTGDQQLDQLQSLARDCGRPVFISGGHDAQRLLSRGLIALSSDLHQEALNIRDILNPFHQD